MVFGMEFLPGSRIPCKVYHINSPFAMPCNVGNLMLFSELKANRNSLPIVPCRCLLNYVGFVFPIIVIVVHPSRRWYIPVYEVLFIPQFASFST